MNTLHFSIDIKAPKERVWRTMLDPDSYKKWTQVFAPGSHYEWSWEQGAEIKFLSQDGGMSAVIAENIPYKFLSIRLLGEIQDGGDTMLPEPTYENYTFTERGGVTEVRVDVDTLPVPEAEEFMKEAWPKALDILKNISE